MTTKQTLNSSLKGRKRINILSRESAECQVFPVSYDLSVDVFSSGATWSCVKYISFCPLSHEQLFFSWNNGIIFLLCSSCEHSTCSTSINENHVFLWPTLHACWIKCPKSFKRTDFWWYAQVSLIYLPHVCPWKNHSLSLCAGECSRWKAWNVKLYHHQPFFLCAGPNCFFLLVCVWERERVWDKVSIYNLQKEGPPPGLAICHPGTCRGCSLVRLKRWNH